MIFFARIRGYFIKIGILKSIAVLTGVAVGVSVLVTFLAMAIVGNYYGRNIIFAAVVPAVTAPAMSYIILKIIFQLNEAEEKLRRLATIDDLTGAYNRRHFVEVAENEVARAHRFGKPFSAIILDIDDFKKINDVHGHSAGDEVLQAVATACVRLCRKIDTFARYGGDEFVFLLPECGLEEAVAFAERIRSAIASLRLERSGKTITVTSSLGVQAYSSGEDTVDQILVRADQSMYVAKESGKNQVSSALLSNA